MNNKIKEFAKTNNVVIYDHMPIGFSEIKGATTAPVGSVWISNNKSRFNGERVTALMLTEEGLTKQETAILKCAIKRATKINPGSGVEYLDTQCKKFDVNKKLLFNMFFRCLTKVCKLSNNNQQYGDLYKSSSNRLVICLGVHELTDDQMDEHNLMYRKRLKYADSYGVSSCAITD